jgi:integrase
MRVYLRISKGKISSENQKKGKIQKNSLYLEWHAGKGQKRQYDFLKLYLYEKPKTNLEREHNKETLKLAETIKAKKILDIQSTSHGFASTVRSKIGFLAYFKQLTDKKYDSSGNHGNWLSTYRHLSEFLKGRDIPLENIDDRFLEGFKEYLLNCQTRKGMRLEKLHRNSSLSYFNKVRAALREAYQNRMIKENPALRIKSVKGEETHRQFLTYEELQKLAKTDCELPLMKKAFLFSCLTGLRWSDVKALTWEKISYSESDGWSIQFTQKKTKGAELLPISEQAIEILGEKANPSEEIFKNLEYNAWNNIKLRNWVLDAGINKKISYHCSRHTYATWLLSEDTDIYTVSKLLGHRNLKTTQVYAQLIDKKKIAAANRLPLLQIV